MIVFNNSSVFTGDLWLLDQSVVVEGGVVSHIVETKNRPRGGEQIDLQGEMLVPGFIDVHVNGGAGELLNHQPNALSINAIGKIHRQFGTTSFIPTLITDTWEQMVNAVLAVAAAQEAGVDGVLGIHLEGPYLNIERRGVHSQDSIRQPASDEDLSRLFAPLAAGAIRLMTLAPEQVPQGFIQQLLRHNVIVSAGHTAANYSQMVEALEQGVSGFTHLFNAMTPMSSREPGVVGAALDDQNSWCGVIVDDYHVHAVTLRQALKAKTRGKMMLVTDAMHTVGAAAGEFDLMGAPIVSNNGRVTTLDGTLAGSNLDMASAVRNTVNILGLDLSEALRMASLYPAQFLGSDQSLGRIAVGCRADFALLNEQLQVLQTWVGGRP
ncbi:MAG: N-acetylglucosamine-6-phosphate deacetylase [Gammaproteobacteria bacterium]|nr:N-acetylglucosamine-6-phosphate deacetylase [Gammaproteobacteria bacterium]